MQTIEKRLDLLEHEAERLRSINEVQNLASMYQYYHQTCTMKRTLELFAMKQPDVMMSMHMGTWEGPDKLRGLYEHVLREDPIGSIMEHHMTTPVIVVAQDNQTAKGVWFTPGVECIPGISKHAYWDWARYGADFIKEDGQWKIWHWQFYTTFRCRFTESFMEEPDHIDMDERVISLCPPSRWDGFDEVYSLDTARRMCPVPPVPYDTWDGVSCCESYNNKEAYYAKYGYEPILQPPKRRL